MPSKDGVLDGLVVVDFTQAIAGPFATRVLAELGARVIKVESLNGDLVRGVQHRPGQGWGPMFGHGSGGKESVSVDMRHPEGRDVVDRLLDHADIVVENFRPGSLERLGFDPRGLVERPKRPVVCSISGFGREAEQSGWSATDPLGQAFSGMTYMIGKRGESPFVAANGIADTSTAMSAVVAILAAVMERQQSGRGRYLDISMADVMLAMDCVNNPVAAAFDDVDWQPLGHDHPAVCPFGVFEASDGFVVIQGMGQGPQSTWGRLCKAIGQDALVDDPRTASEAARLENREVVNGHIRGWVQERTRTEVVTELQAAGTIAGPVHDPREAVTHPFYAARNGVRKPDTAGEPDELAHPMVALPFAQAGLTDRPARPPKLGEHNGTILAELLGLSASDIHRLYEVGAVQTRIDWP